MAQIYTEQQKVDRTPVAPDTSLITTSEKQIQGGLDALTKLDENQKDFEAKQKLWEAQQAEKSQEELLTNYKNARLQIFQNASTIHSHNMAEYQKTTSEAVAKLDASIPDSKEKINVMASTNIDASGYTAKVQKNMMDSAEMRRVESIKENIFSSMLASKSGAGSLFDSMDKNLSPAQRAQALSAWKDSQIGLKRAYDMRNAQDANGNFMFSASERAKIKDDYENGLSNSVLDYAGDNVLSNRRGVENLRNELIKNKDTIIKQFGANEKKYQKTLSGLDSILSRNVTREHLQAKNDANVTNKATLTDMDIQLDGTVGNSAYNNLDSLVGVYTKLENDENNGYYISPQERQKIAQYKAKVGKAIIKQAEGNPTLSSGKGWFGNNAGGVAVQAVNEKMKGFEGSYVFNSMTDDEKVAIKAKMYIETIGQLQMFEKLDENGKKRAKEQLILMGIKGAENLDNFKLNSKEPYALELAKSLAQGSYYSQIEGMIGYRPDIPKDATIEDKNRIYKEHYFKYNNKASYDYLSELAGLK